jgi:RNA polymerase sigma factor (sigma-70 family)
LHGGLFFRILRSVPVTQKHAEFPATRWSIIIRATATPSPLSHDALEDLCRLYWPPLYAFLRRSGQTPHEAQDLVQGYLARLLEREDLSTVSADKGRFRSYLLAGLRNFLVSEARQASALKRGGRAEIISLDIENAEALYSASLADGATPDLAFDRRWAETILDHALEKLRQENITRGKAKLYETLKPSLATDAADDYAALGRELAMTPGAIAVALHRLRLRFRALVRAAVADTVGSEADLEDEMRNFVAILSH